MCLGKRRRLGLMRDVKETPFYGDDRNMNWWTFSSMSRVSGSWTVSALDSLEVAKAKRNEPLWRVIFMSHQPDGSMEAHRSRIRLDECCMACQSFPKYIHR